jgi:hypothetical protein
MRGSAGLRAGQTGERRSCCQDTTADEVVEPSSQPAQYLLHILDAAVGQGDACHPHGTPIAIGALSVELGPSRLIDIVALGTQEFLEDGDDSCPITSVRVLLVLLGKPREEKEGRTGFQRCFSGLRKKGGLRLERWPWRPNASSATISWEKGPVEGQGS